MAKIDLNSYPYFDDYTPEKGFHRVLFKPGYAVQARELTQLQTILQQQIKRFGDNIFKDGSVISGCPESTNFNVPYVKILDTNSLSQTVSNDTLANYEGQTLLGLTTGVKAFIKKVSTGDQTSSTSYKTLFVQYTSQGYDNVTTTFEADEVLQLESDNTVTFIVAGSGVSPIGTGSIMTVGTGIVYADGTFILNADQTIILEKFSSTPTKKVGFIVDEQVIDSGLDDTLLDPAQGSFNYTAPGADRFKLTTQLVAYNSVDVPAQGFYILFDIFQGKIVRRYDKTQYAELNKTLARRTFDESGDYTVRPFGLVIRENLNDEEGNGGLLTATEGGNAALLSIGVEPGKAYVKGFEYEIFSTLYLDVDKALDSVTKQNISVSTAYGNYVTVNTISGVLPLNDIEIIIDLKNAGSAAIIGRARALSLEYISGTIGMPDAVYNVYLTDIQMFNGSFDDVRILSYTGGTPNFSATIILDTGIAKLYDSFYAPLLFKLPANNVKTLNPVTVDNRFVYKKQFNSTFNGSGQFTITVSGNETFAFSSSTTSTIQQEVIVIRDSTGAYIQPSIVSISSTSITFSYPSFTSGTATSFVSVQKANVSPRAKTLKPGYFVKFQTSKSYASASTTTPAIDAVLTIGGGIQTSDILIGGEVYSEILGVFTFLGTVISIDLVNSKITLNRTVPIALSSQKIHVQTHPAYDIKNDRLITSLSLGVHDVLKVEDIQQADSSVAFPTGTTFDTGWSTASSDFIIMNGQTDTFYDYASLVAAKGVSLRNKRLVAKITWFQHDTPTSAGYFSIDSYPLPTQGSAASSIQIEWFEIPRHTANTGAVYDLRNTLDFRPSVTRISAASASTMSAATVNPVTITHTVDIACVASTGSANITNVDGLTASNISIGDRVYSTNKVYLGRVLSYVGTTITLEANSLANATSIIIQHIIPKDFVASIFTPHPQEEFITDVSWNLSRVDRIVLDSEGSFTTITGVSSEAPEPQRQPDNAMTLGFVSIPAFPSMSPYYAQKVGRKEQGTKSTTLDHRRYTMKDIGSIETRLNQLQRFTKLSFLEQKTINQLIANASGVDRFKNGVLVDSFERHNIGNINSPGYSCTISGGQLSPTVRIENVQFDLSNSSTNIVRSAADATIVVRQTAAAAQYTVGQTVSNGLGASGTIKHKVLLGQNSNLRWVRLYLENVVSVFAEGNNINSIGVIHSASHITEQGVYNSILATELQPDNVSIPADGNLVTLPYVHKVYTENPYASGTINTVNTVVFNYEGDIGLSPAADVWFDVLTPPEIVVRTQPPVIANPSDPAPPLPAPPVTIIIPEPVETPLPEIDPPEPELPPVQHPTVVITQTKAIESFVEVPVEVEIWQCTGDPIPPGPIQLIEEETPPPCTPIQPWICILTTPVCGGAIETIWAGTPAEIPAPEPVQETPAVNDTSTYTGGGGGGSTSMWSWNGQNNEYLQDTNQQFMI